MTDQQMWTELRQANMNDLHQIERERLENRIIEIGIQRDDAYEQVEEITQQAREIIRGQQITIDRLYLAVFALALVAAWGVCR